MYIIVVGAGKVGYNLIKQLMAQDHEVLLVEKDPSVFNKLYEELKEIVFYGDGTELSTLKEIGTNRADVLVAATGSDEDNLVICQMAKLMFLLPRTIARVNDPKNEDIMQTLGIDTTVSGTSAINRMIQSQVDPAAAIPLLTLKDTNVEIVQMEIPEHSIIVNKRVRDLDLPLDSILVAAIRGNQVIIPKGDTVLEASDTIIGLTRKESREVFRQAFL